MISPFRLFLELNKRFTDEQIKTIMDELVRDCKLAEINTINADDEKQYMYLTETMGEDEMRRVIADVLSDQLGPDEKELKELLMDIKNL